MKFLLSVIVFLSARTSKIMTTLFIHVTKCSMFYMHFNTYQFLIRAYTIDLNQLKRLYPFRALTCQQTTWITLCEGCNVLVSFHFPIICGIVCTNISELLMISSLHIKMSLSFRFYCILGVINAFVPPTLLLRISGYRV